MSPHSSARLASFLALGSMVAWCASARPEAPLPEVLIVHSYHFGMAWTDEVSIGLIDSLAGSAEPVFTQLDVKRHPPDSDDALLAVVAAKAAIAQPRVIVAIDDYAYQFVLRHRERIGAATPVVFGGVNFFTEPRPPGVTGVIESIDVDATLDLVAALQPDARRWVIINDTSETGMNNRKATERALLKRWAPEVTWIGSESFANTERALATLDPSEDAVLLLSWNLDADGLTRSYEDAVSRARRLSRAPLYGVWGFYFGRGIVGGALLDGREHGREVGGLVRRVLQGEPVDDIPIIDQCRAPLRVDAREMNRLGLSEAGLPAGASLEFVEHGLWSLHGAKIVAVVLLLALQSATITWLLIARRHRQQALRRLGESEANLRKALDHLETAQELACIGSWELDPQRAQVTLSREMHKMLGLAPDARTPQYADILALFHPEDRPLIERAMARIESTGIPTTFEVRGDPARENSRTFRLMIQRQSLPQWPGPCLCGTLQDITAEARAQNLARESRERMQLALEGADVGIWTWDIATDRVTFDDQCLERLGHAAGKLSPKPQHWAHLLHPDDLLQVVQIVKGYRARTISKHEVEFRIRHANGSWVRVLSKGRVIESAPDGAPLRAAGTHLDITERHQREQALRSTEHKLAEIFRSSPEVIALTRVSDGRFLEINAAFSRVFGFTHDEVVGHTSVELNIWPKPEDRTRLLHMIKSGGAIRDQEINFRDKFGRLIPFQVSVAPITSDGEACLIWLLTDITERKRAEQERTHLQEQLLHAMKMDAVGRLAGGIAHDFNNLLTVITGNVELLRCDLEPGSPQVAVVNDVATAAASAAGLTRQLLAFSRRQIIEPKVLDLNELIGNLRKMLGRLIGEDIALELKLADNLGAVRVDPGQFEQVIVNLTVNARDAMPKGGCMTITTADREIEIAGEHARLNPGRYVVLSVTDTGHGMTPEVKRRLFEPFFTTKPLGRGTGLGLATTFGVVKQAGGAIEVDTEVNRGTTFRIFIPCVDEPTESLSQNLSTDNLPRGTETILLVEDDPAVRTITSSLLTRLGYHVVAACDGYDGIEKASHFAGPLHLVLTDLVMPGIGGRETAEQVRLAHPGAAVLYTSGYTEDAILRQGIMSDSVAFISKPYTIQGIAAKVRETIDVSASHSRATVKGTRSESRS
ncbi:MAG: PAS domain S-box protein [Opitutaceae bacterium]|nr:PAS domain S-box protein [Opitutaceae bacterium]